MASAPKSIAPEDYGLDPLVPGDSIFDITPAHFTKLVQLSTYYAAEYLKQNETVPTSMALEDPEAVLAYSNSLIEETLPEIGAMAKLVGEGYPSAGQAAADVASEALLVPVLPGESEFSSRFLLPPPMTHPESDHELIRATEALLRHYLGAARVSWNTAGGGYLAYVPGGGLLSGPVADLLSSVLNRYTGVFAAAAGPVQLENNVIRWLCSLVGFSHKDGAWGLSTSGGSISNLIGLVAARSIKCGEDFSKGRLYTSSQTHLCVAKAAMMAGLRRDQVVSIPVGSDYRVDTAAMAAAMEADQAAGWRPFALVGNAGTTNTGAVDDLTALADLAAKYDAWFHVDGAYGGFFVITDRGRKALAGIERADSVALDGHKSAGFMPYSIGYLLAANGAALKHSFSVFGEYLPDQHEDLSFSDATALGPELTKPPRGLRMWLSLKLFGLSSFRAALDQHLDRAKSACSRLEAAISQLEILARPQLTTFAFRLAPAPGETLEATNARNKAFLTKILSRRRIFLSPTTLDGRFVIRFIVLCFRTRDRHIDAAIQDITWAASKILAGSSGDK